VTLPALRDAAIADARSEAERALADADREAAGRLAKARSDAEAILERASASGEAEGRIAVGRELARLHAEARAAVLGARRDAYDELRSRAHEAALGLRADPGYPELLERLAAAARRALGADAELELDPSQAGGVRARSGTHSVDLTLPVLADRCIAGLGTTLRRLWT
jgi:vacuolar-type H+-ATPase subunit E/Vma4